MSHFAEGAFLSVNAGENARSWSLKAWLQATSSTVLAQHAAHLCRSFPRPECYCADFTSPMGSGYGWVRSPPGNQRSPCQL